MRYVNEREPMMRKMFEAVAAEFIEQIKAETGEILNIISAATTTEETQKISGELKGIPKMVGMVKKESELKKYQKEQDRKLELMRKGKPETCLYCTFEKVDRDKDPCNICSRIKRSDYYMFLAE